MKREGLPLRKYLFYGLTIILASVFIFLAVMGRRMEKEKMKQGSEVVQNYTPTPTRALAPVDLEILKTSLVREQEAVRLGIEIKNSGPVSYTEIQLILDYLDAGGSVLLSIPHKIRERIVPGETLLLTDIPADNIPVEATSCRAKIAYADIEPGE